MLAFYKPHRFFLPSLHPPSYSSTLPSALITTQAFCYHSPTKRSFTTTAARMSAVESKFDPKDMVCFAVIFGQIKSEYQLIHHQGLSSPRPQWFEGFGLVSGRMAHVWWNPERQHRERVHGNSLGKETIWARSAWSQTRKLMETEPWNQLLRYRRRLCLRTM